MTSVQETRLWALAGVVVTLAVIGLGWLLLVSPQLETSNQVRAEQVAVWQQNEALTLRVAELEEADARLPELRVELETARQELPVRNQTDAFSADLQAAAEQNLISVASVSIGTPQDSTALAQGVAEADAQAADESIRHTYALPVTFTVEGAAGRVDSFLSDIQARSQRALLVDKAVVLPKAGISGGSIAKDIVVSYSGYIYVSPLDAESAAQLYGTADVATGVSAETATDD